MTNDFEKVSVIGAKIILQSWAEPIDVKPCSAVEHCEMAGSFVELSRHLQVDSDWRSLRRKERAESAMLDQEQQWSLHRLWP